MKQHLRYCPKCKLPLFYTRKSSCIRMKNKNSLCISCSKRKFDVSNNKENGIYFKLCPNCNVNKISYTTEKGLKYAIQNNTLCKKCKTSIKELLIYKRKCPKCKKELFTKNKFWNELAINENRWCSSCRLRGRIFTKKWKNRLKLNHADFSGKNNPFYQKHHTEFYKEKLSNISDEKRRLLREKFSVWLLSKHSKPTYSIKACKFIDKLNKDNGWNLQHALNGGEQVLCGYWIDGYDKNKNVVFEYDEPRHYKADGMLRQKDIKRQEEIIRSLHCKFYRYNEVLNNFYEITLNETDSKN